MKADLCSHQWLNEEESFELFVLLLKDYFIFSMVASPPRPSTNEIVQSEALSRLATRNTFIRTLSDGMKPEDAAYRGHEWLDGFLDEFEDHEW
jgi:hypothetical protein